MKEVSIFILVLFFTFSNAQEKIFGKYKNDNGETLTLNSDYTFDYSWKFDLASSWNVGTWQIKNDNNIYLKVIKIKDTLKSDSKIELVLSNDKISNEISNEEYGLGLISGGGQSRNLPPKKLLIKNGKLYSYSKDGKIQNKKVKSVMNSPFYQKPWFNKINETQTDLKTNEFTGRIINEILMPGNCGYIAFATVMEFEIIESKIKNYENKSIPIIVKCPELFGENFFNKNITYKIKIDHKSGSKFGWTVPNLKESTKYNLVNEYWLTNIEKL